VLYTHAFLNPALCKIGIEVHCPQHYDNNIHIHTWYRQEQRNRFVPSLQEKKRKDLWFQASAAILMKSALFWGVTQSQVVILYWRFRTMYRSHLQVSKSPLHWTSWPFKMGPIRCTETSVQDYHSTLHNTPEERRSQVNISYDSFRYSVPFLI
jgi:hypothetical protein